MKLSDQKKLEIPRLRFAPLGMTTGGGSRLSNVLKRNDEIRMTNDEGNPNE
jgi:hypothetical protein